VSVNPGHTLFTVMPSAPNSFRERFGQARYARAQSIGKQQAVDGLFHGHGCNRQQASPMIALHAREHFAREIDIAQQGQLNRCAPIFEADVEKLFCRRAARIRDADIDPPYFLSTSSTKARTASGWSHPPRAKILHGCWPSRFRWLCAQDWLRSGRRWPLRSLPLQNSSAAARPRPLLAAATIATRPFSPRSIC